MTRRSSIAVLAVVALLPMLAGCAQQAPKTTTPAATAPREPVAPLAAPVVATRAAAAATYSEEAVSFSSGGVRLRGVLARPHGDGPFAAYVHVHGSATVETASSPPWTSLVHGSYLEALVREGYVVLRLARRGHFGSEGTTYNYHLAQRTGDVPTAHAVFSSIQTDAGDVLAAFDHLRTLPYVDPERLAVGGHSVGGLVSVLAGARESRLRAVVSFAGGFTWREGSRETSWSYLDRAWRDSARAITAPVLILWSKNDSSLEPDVGRELEKRLKAAGKPVEMIVYPPHGQNGHFLFSRTDGTQVFLPDLLRFLNDNLTRIR